MEKYTAANLCIKQEASLLQLHRPLPEIVAIMNSSTITPSMSAGLNNISISQPNLSQLWRSQTTLPAIIAKWSTWQYVVTFVLGVIIYDQGNKRRLSRSQFSSLMISVMYIKRKGTIAGPSFKIPLMGPFLQALDPKFDSYLAQWASGPLSCVSVFHK